MGEANRKREQREQSAWPHSDSYRGPIDLHMLPPVAAINGARIRELTGDNTIPNAQQIILVAYRAVVGDRTFHVGFCLGNETGFSAIGIAVIDRLMMEAPGAPLHVVPVAHQEIAWDIVLRAGGQPGWCQSAFITRPDTRLAKDFDGVIHWARDTETFQSILKSFIRLDMESVGPPELPAGWQPEITIFPANEGSE